MAISLESIASQILIGFSPNYNSKYEAYIAIKIQIFISYEFRLIWLDYITCMQGRRSNLESGWDILN